MYWILHITWDQERKLPYIYIGGEMVAPYSKDGIFIYTFSLMQY